VIATTDAHAIFRRGRLPNVELGRRAAGHMVLGLAGIAAAGCTKLGALNAVMPHDRGAARVAEGIRYGPADRQNLDVYAPTDAETPAPVVVFIYGGGWDSGRRADYAFVGHALASRGFVTVIPDYRLVPEVRYPTFVADCADAVRWADGNIGAYGGDPARIGVAGHSAGAYNAVMLGVAPAYVAPADDPPLPVKAVAGLAGPYDFLPLDTGATRRAFKGVANLPETQPVTIVSALGPPLFLAHGTADGTVQPANLAAMADAARNAGREVTVKRYADLGHAGILLAMGRWFRGNAPVLDDLTAFFRRTLAAESAAPSASAG
jgi:acetyl esterase/lipase